MDQDNIIIEQLNYTEIGKIMPILFSLADHHNKVSKYFSGNYPLKTFEKIISEISEKIKNKYSIVDIIKINDKIIGFSQYTIEQNIGKLEYLVILPEYRNRGYGKLLMNKALKYFETKVIKKIDIKVVYGNDDAIKFYENYGFQVSSQIMSIIIK
jgi:ribosomal protein S18 acetylase RimI-like enzyme